jgi:hypothetical protein
MGHRHFESGRPVHGTGRCSGQFQRQAEGIQPANPPPQSGTTPNFTVDEIWASPIFLGSIFAQPTVVNGSVYVPTYGSGVEVFYPTNQ